MALPDVYSKATQIAPDQDVAPGFGFRIACTTPGNFVLIMSDGSRYIYNGTQGQCGEDGFAIRGYSTKDVPAPVGAGIVQVVR